MFKINLYGLAIFSFIVLPVSFIVHVPVLGVLMFILLNTIVIVNRKLFKGLDKIDKNVSSFEYLKSFDAWMEHQISINKKMSHFLYPYMFITVVLGLWYSSSFQETLDRVFGTYQPDMVYGIPIYWMLSGLIILILLGIFGGRIYKWDLNLVYGRIIKKLKELIKDMEELRAE